MSLDIHFHCAVCGNGYFDLLQRELEFRESLIRSLEARRVVVLSR